MTDKTFLETIKLILDKAKTSTSYKFALLLVIAKLCRDEADSDGFLSYEQLTDEIMVFYAPHNKPFIHEGKPFVLRQTNGRRGGWLF